MRKKKFLDKKNLWIYGIGRPQKDFQYVFDECNIQGYIWDAFAGQEWLGKPVYTLEKFKNEIFNTQIGIIICDFSTEGILDNFSQYGLTYQEDYFFAEDFFEMLDYPINEKIGDRSVVLWGTGKYAKEFLTDVKGIFKVEFFIDNNPQKDNISFQSAKVSHPDDLSEVEWKNYYIIIASSYYSSIKRQLEEYGLKEYQDFIYFELVKPISEWFKKTYYDKSYYDLECYSMLNHLDLGVRGTIHNCCATFLDASIGSLLVQDMNAIWKSKLHKVFCVSALNKSFSFCKKDLCPVLINKTRMEYVENFQQEVYQKPEENATVTNIAFDFSCNLYCKTCRTQIEIAINQDREDIELLTDKILNQVVPHAQFIMMAGDGEVFLSKAYEKIWSSDKSKYCKYFQVLSNGTMFTKQKWSKLVENRSSDILFCVSIDAATEVTYKKLRRGGNWQDLLQNMKFAAQLRRQNKIKYFRMNFVVQRENYLEIPAFIELGKRLAADRILFTKILNWGTYTDDEFEQISMVDKDGKPKLELEEILKLPICQERIVDLGTIRWKHNYVDTKTVDNYYLWEVENYKLLNNSF